MDLEQYNWVNIADWDGHRAELNDTYSRKATRALVDRTNTITVCRYSIFYLDKTGPVRQRALGNMSFDLPFCSSNSSCLLLWILPNRQTVVYKAFGTHRDAVLWFYYD